MPWLYAENASQTILGAGRAKKGHVFGGAVIPVLTGTLPVALPHVKMERYKFPGKEAEQVKSQLSSEIVPA